jgi:hypothetical protein
MKYRLQVVDQTPREVALVPLPDELAESLKAGPNGIFHMLESLVGQALDSSGVDFKEPLVVSLQKFQPAVEQTD